MIDKLDGKGPSGIAMDTSNCQVYSTMWIGKGPVYIGSGEYRAKFKDFDEFCEWLALRGKEDK